MIHHHEHHFHQISTQLDSALHDRGLSPAYVERLVRDAVVEDLDGGIDITTHSTVPPSHRSEVVFRARAAGCISGLPVVATVLEMMCGTMNLKYEVLVADGDVVTAGTSLLRAEAPTRDLLTAERTSLNLLCHMSGVAAKPHPACASWRSTRCVVAGDRTTA